METVTSAPPARKALVSGPSEVGDPRTEIRLAIHPTGSRILLQKDRYLPKTWSPWILQANSSLIMVQQY